jgi:thiol-disulfide isomerase/thioredoxin
MRLVMVTAVALLITGGALAQEAQGPADAKAQKTFQTAMDWVREHKYGAAVDSFKKADKQDGGHCDECARRIIKYALEDGNYKDAEVAAQQLIADAKDPQAQAQAHQNRAGLLMKEAQPKGKPELFAEADREYQAALTLTPDDKAANYYDGMALAHLNQDDAAKARFRKFLEVAGANNVDRLRAQRFIENVDLARARMAPAFTVMTLNGDQVSLDGLAGKVVLIDFWATWCGPCREALPHLRDIAQKFSGEPLVVISISLDSDEAAWKSFVAKNGMTWLQYRDGGWTGQLARAFDVNAIPHTFTIDADGVLQDEHVGDANLTGKLKKLCARAREMQEAPKTAVATAGN